jgi:hypothetical protein
MAHAIPIGTRLVLTLPFTDEMLDGEECEPFCPGLTGTVECWVVGHMPHVPDRHGYITRDPQYIISPYKEYRLAGIPVWEYLADMSARMQASDTPLSVQAVTAMLTLEQLRLESDVSERLLLPFIA